jgi:hypothetical protein
MHVFKLQNTDWRFAWDENQLPVFLEVNFGGSGDQV